MPDPDEDRWNPTMSIAFSRWLAVHLLTCLRVLIFRRRLLSTRPVRDPAHLLLLSSMPPKDCAGKVNRFAGLLLSTYSGDGVAARDQLMMVVVYQGLAVVIQRSDLCTKPRRCQCSRRVGESEWNRATYPIAVRFRVSGGLPMTRL